MEKSKREKIKSFIEATLTSGSRRPGLFELPKMLFLKGEIELRSQPVEVVAILTRNKDKIVKAFGLQEHLFDKCIEDILSV